MNNCNRRVQKYLTYDEHSEAGEYDGLEGGMNSWRDLGGKQLPCDMTLRNFLGRFSTDEIDHAEELSEHFQQMQNGLTKDDLASVSCDLMGEPCPGLDIVGAVEHVERLGQAPIETDLLSNTLVRAATGEVGIILTSFNSVCSAPRCPFPLFEDGQLVVVLPGSEGVQWRHPIIGESVSAAPLMNFQESCKPCGEKLPDEHETFVNVFWRNPRHTTFDEEGRVYPCTTDANFSSGAPSPDSILCPDQDDSDSGTGYGCGSAPVDRGHLPPPVTISFANSSLVNGPPSTGGGAQRAGSPPKRKVLRVRRR